MFDAWKIVIDLTGEETHTLSDTFVILPRVSISARVRRWSRMRYRRRHRRLPLLRSSRLSGRLMDNSWHWSSSKFCDVCTDSNATDGHQLVRFRGAPAMTVLTAV